MFICYPFKYSWENRLGNNLDKYVLECSEKLPNEIKQMNLIYMENGPHFLLIVLNLNFKTNLN